MSAVGMPPHLLALFQSRPPLEFLKPPKKRKMPPYTGLAECVKHFEEGPPPPVVHTETPKERRERIRRERQRRHKAELAEKIEEYERRFDYSPSEEGAHGYSNSAASPNVPNSRLPNAKLTSDPLRTLFIGRVNYETTEKKLKREFERYGPIRRVQLIYDWNGKPRGYGFIEFENDKDMKETYKRADGTKIDDWRVIVDVERGRTVVGWLPRRLGGGRGPPRGAASNKGKSGEHAPEPAYTKPITYESSSDRYSRYNPIRPYNGGGTSGSPDHHRPSRRPRSRSRERRSSRDHDKRRNRSRSRSRNRTRPRPRR